MIHSFKNINNDFYNNLSVKTYINQPQMINLVIAECNHFMLALILI